jgi:2-dehydro-3-deoxy-D-arabinonate dehydratase
MPLCRFKLQSSYSQMTRLGWVDLAGDRVFELADSLANLLTMDRERRLRHMGALQRSNVGVYPVANVTMVAPADQQEVWAAGVTYDRSRDARMEESTHEDVYSRVYEADRPEIFFKLPGWRCVGPDEPVAIRSDSHWNVPEPELTLVIDSSGTIAGYTIGNDVSSRSIEGENPLYLPQAKTYTASCALGPWIVLVEELEDVSDLRIGIVVERRLDDLTRWLYRALGFPYGALLMTGTGIVPPSDFTLEGDDLVTVEIDRIGTLSNPVFQLEMQ